MIELMQLSIMGIASGFKAVNIQLMIVQRCPKNWCLVSIAVFKFFIE